VQAEPELHAMLEAIRHEPSYRIGTWIDESLGVYVGWTARPNSFSDGMPLRNEREDVVLVASGEEFPEPDLKNRLRAQGHRFERAGPAYLVHVYEESPTFPAELNGRFHGIVADRRRGIVTLFNDRYGMHRIYYKESEGTFYFATEAKAILKVPGMERVLDPRGLGEYISCGCVLENRTLFKNILVLPIASKWIFRNGALEDRSSYFVPCEWEEQSTQDPESFYRDLRDVFSRNLPRYFNGPQSIAISLTGGLDTRAIMAWHKSAPDSLRCYTFGGMFRDSQDVKVARQVAKMCQQPHQVITVDDGFLGRFAHYAERTVYLSDGCTSVSHSPDLYVNEIATQIAPVRMTGNYGDEVLRRQRVFKPAAAPQSIFSRELSPHIEKTQQTYDRLVQQHPLSFAVFCQAPWHHYGLLALEQTQVSLRTPYLDNDFVRQAFRAPLSACTNNDLRSRLIADGNATLGQLITDLGFGGSYASPFLAPTRRLLRFTMKAEYAFDYGMPQWLARIDHQLSPFHPERLFLGRHKFYHFRVWYRDTLASYVREMLLDTRTLSRSCFEGRTIEPLVRDHLAGRRNYTSQIHQLLTAELVHRVFLDRN
jgi:asparagine synthase (glutamine-hydrolysing)